MSLAVELVLVHIVNELGGKVTFRDLQLRTNLSARTLKKYLWYCQRRKLLKRDIGVYYITKEGLSMLDDKPIVKFNKKIYAVRLPNQICLITLGKKMRVREIKMEAIRQIISKGCVSKNDVKNNDDYKTLASVLRLLKLMGAVKYKNDKICFETIGANALRDLGIL